MDLVKLDFKGHEVRTIREDGEILWVLTDVATAMGYESAKDAMRLVENDEKGRRISPTLGGEQEVLVINEPGLYRLIFSSRKPEAKAFQRWVFHEVLPQIRKTGRYLHPSLMISLYDLMDRFGLRADTIAAAVDWSLPWHGDKVVRAIRNKDYSYAFSPEEALLILVRVRPGISYQTLCLMFPQMQKLSISSE